MKNCYNCCDSCEECEIKTTKIESANEEKLIEKLKATMKKNQVAFHNLKSQIEIKYELLTEFEKDILELIANKNYISAEKMLESLEEYKYVSSFYKNVY